MKDELASRRKTRTIKRAASGNENVQEVIGALQALLDAKHDTKGSLRVFLVELRDPQALAHYEKETGETGIYDVVNALFPDRQDIIASVLTDD